MFIQITDVRMVVVIIYSAVRLLWKVSKSDLLEISCLSIMACEPLGKRCVVPNYLTFMTSNVVWYFASSYLTCREHGARERRCWHVELTFWLNKYVYIQWLNTIRKGEAMIEKTKKTGFLLIAANLAYLIESPCIKNISLLLLLLLLLATKVSV